MSRHFTKEENEKNFSEYTKNRRFIAIRKMKEISPSFWNIKNSSIATRLNRIILYYNNGMKELLADKKKGNNRKPGSGRPKKSKNIPEPDWSKVKTEEFIEIAKRYYKIVNEFPDEVETNKDK